MGANAKSMRVVSSRTMSTDKRFDKHWNTVKSKYGNKKTIVDNIAFDSKKEAIYYAELKLLQRSGKVLEFERQVKYEIQPKFVDDFGNKHRSIYYVADFVVKYHDGMVDIVDCKGYRTKEYLLKKKLLAAKGIIIKEI